MINYSIANISGIDGLPTGTDDIFIYVIGYEERSRFVRSRLSTKCRAIAIDYRSEGRGDYDENAQIAAELGDVVVAANHDIRDRVAGTLKRRADAPLRIFVDISCMDRTLMSEVLIALMQCLEGGDHASFLYTPASFREPPLYLAPMRRFSAAIPDLAGPVGNPYKKRALIMGLGYEYGAALNVIDMIEPQYIHLFHPVGDDPRFLPFVKRANFDFEFGNASFDLSEYSISDPVNVHGIIRDLVVSLRDMSSVVIVPFGPKILSAVCILIALNNRDDVSLMRYSVESIDYFPKTSSSGSIYGFNLALEG